MRRAQGHTADADLARLFDALARVLIPLDVTPSRLAQIARVSFVKASATQAQMKGNGRPHLAKIAALTGLTRSEVKRLVASGFRSDVSRMDYLPRALRVLEAWQISSPYASGGKPRQLRILGRPPSFSSLCKAHSGDIPYTVIMDELERRQRVVVSRRSNKIAVAKRKRGTRSATREHAALSFAAAFLQDALKENLVIVRRKQRITSSSNLSDAYVENAI